MALQDEEQIIESSVRKRSAFEYLKQIDIKVWFLIVIILFGLFWATELRIPPIFTRGQSFLMGGIVLFMIFILGVKTKQLDILEFKDIVKLHKEEMPKILEIMNEQDAEIDWEMPVVLHHLDDIPTVYEFKWTLKKAGKKTIYTCERHAAKGYITAIREKPAGWTGNEATTFVKRIP